MNRLLILDGIPANAESWLLGKVFRRAGRLGIRGIIAFSDPQARTVNGRTFLAGHVGICYQAHNGRYVGRGTPRTLTLLPDGTVLSARVTAKLTGLEPGWRGAVHRLIALGAPPPGPQEHPGRWLPAALEHIGASQVRDRGNHRYVWTLPGAHANDIALPALPFPKTPDPIMPPR